MYTSTINSVLSLIPLITSGVSATSQPFHSISIKSSGVPRTFLQSFPPNFNPDVPTPVILSYHGATRTSEEQYNLSQMSNPYFNDFAIAVYPQGVGKTWQGAPGNTANDTVFTHDILAALAKNFTIDTNRIYATGKSQGGGFVGVLACDPVLSTTIAAFAPVSGAFYIKNDTKCAPATIHIPCNNGRTNIPMIEFHGGEDGTIKYNGAGRNHECVPSIPHWIRQWANRDDFAFPKNVSSTIAKDTTLYQFGEGADLGRVSHVFDSVIDHDWPSTLPNDDNDKAGRSPASFNASSIIIDFFNKYTLDK